MAHLFLRVVFCKVCGVIYVIQTEETTTGNKTVREAMLMTPVELAVG
jgi:hypothetical protein